MFPHRGVPCFAAADCSTQRSTSDNFRCSHVAKGLTYPTEVRACRDLIRGGGYAPPASPCRKFVEGSQNRRQTTWFVEGFAFDKPLSSKFVEKKFVEGSLTIITSSLRCLARPQCRPAAFATRQVPLLPPYLSASWRHTPQCDSDTLHLREKQKLRRRPGKVRRRLQVGQKHEGRRAGSRLRLRCQV